MKSCIDLTTRFGSRYRVCREESYYAQYGKNGRADDPWLLVMPCRHGEIYPHGGEMLGASTHCRGGMAKRLAALPCVTLVQDGSDGINVVFHVDDFTTIADILKPRRRRRLTPEQTADRVERLRKHQFKAIPPASQSDFDAPIRDPKGPADRNPGFDSARLNRPSKNAGGRP